MDDLERTYSPAEAAEAFHFAPSLLRRYASIYESLGGTIPHDRRGGRLYSQTVLRHFTQARERVKAGETVEDALRTLDLAPAETVTDAHTTLDAKEVLSLFERLADANGQILEGVQAISTRLDAVDRLEAEVAALREEVAATRALPPGANAARIDRALEVELMENQPPPEQSTAPSDNDVSQAHITDGPGAADGLLVRAARWVERRLRR